MAQHPELASRVSANDIPVSNPNGIESTYANNIGVGTTMTDVRLLFTEVGQEFSAEGSAQPSPSNVLKANVVIPPAQAGALMQALSIALQQQQAHVAEQQKMIQAATANAKKPSKA
jgi:hypothetical protein